MGFEYRNSAERYKGDQYFNSWTKGFVFLKNGDIVPDIFIRYDKFMDELLWLRETDFKTGVLAHDDISGFVLNNLQNDRAEFVIKRIKLPYKSDSSDVFLQILVKGNLELCAYRKVKQSANDFRLLDDTRYLIFRGGKSYFVGLNKSGLLKVPVVDEVRMKEAIKSGKIRFDGTEGKLVQAIELYNRME
jgi:hypothetical protein